MKLFDPYRLYTAFALNKDTFGITFSGSEYDDMYSYILIHEGHLEQPWSRFDVPRNITGLTGQVAPDGRPIFYALSDEGEVYTLPAGDDEPGKLKIEGAGVWSDDATDLGYVNSIALIGGALLVTGYHSQLYRVSETGWDWFHEDTLPRAPETYDYLIFGDLDGPAEDDLYMSVTYSPTSTNRELTEEEEDEMDRLYLAGKNDEAYAIRKAAEGPSRVHEGRLYHWNGEEWRIVATPRAGRYEPTPATLADIFVEAPDRVWAVGHNGVILLGNATYGFQDVSFKGDDDSLISITRFRDKMVIASNYALHWFDGHMLSPLRPVLDPSINDGVPNPLKVQAVDDLLFYFDSKHGVRTFDGEHWTQITIPPELLERNFKGLPRP
ncbi:hypothetical protein [Afifella aestuarii]|uniref:hypothetical protein n=1 Tax=Afifella aestuarii TaxID=1909496 RepID=UPI001FE8ABE0|nr:hypothetical protein [Afifella aestuarii]